VGNLTADQLTFINAIITHLTKNGMIDKGMLFEPPFKDIHNQGIFGVFINEKVRQNLLSAIDKVNGNAVA
jgi:type I restriction enzyme R subunit